MKPAVPRPCHPPNEAALPQLGEAAETTLPPGHRVLSL